MGKVTKKGVILGALLLPPQKDSSPFLEEKAGPFDEGTIWARERGGDLAHQTTIKEQERGQMSLNPQV